jgi:hypothetical protein
MPKSNPNGYVNSRGKIISNPAGPKPTNDGKNLGPHATNVIGGTKATTKPLSPNANGASRDK